MTPLTNLILAAAAILLVAHKAEAGAYRRIVIARGNVTGTFTGSGDLCYDIPLFDFATNESVGRLVYCFIETNSDPDCPSVNITTTADMTIDADRLVFDG